MKDRFGVEFPIYDKVDVNGGGAHPLYAALKKYEPELSGYSPKLSWNFTVSLDLSCLGISPRSFVVYLSSYDLVSSCHSATEISHQRGRNAGPPLPAGCRPRGDGGRYFERAPGEKASFGSQEKLERVLGGGEELPCPLEADQVWVSDLSV